MKAFTYVRGIWFHRTDSIYKLGMLKPERYCDIAIDLITEKLSRVENISCEKKHYSQEKVIRKVERYNQCLKNLFLIKNIKNVTSDFLKNELEFYSNVSEYGDGVSEKKDYIHARKTPIIKILNDIDFCRKSHKDKLYVSCYSLDDLIKSHPLFKSQRDRLDVISSSSIYLEDLIRSNPVFKSLSQEALI